MSHSRDSIATQLKSVGIHNEALITTILAYNGGSLGASWGYTGRVIVFSWYSRGYDVTLECQAAAFKHRYILRTTDSITRTSDGAAINKILDEKLKVYLFWTKFN